VQVRVLQTLDLAKAEISGRNLSNVPVLHKLWCVAQEINVPPRTDPSPDIACRRCLNARRPKVSKVLNGVLRQSFVALVSSRPPNSRPLSSLSVCITNVMSHWQERFGNWEAWAATLDMEAFVPCFTRRGMIPAVSCRWQREIHDIFG
jgi:hypothetical protein